MKPSGRRTWSVLAVVGATLLMVALAIVISGPSATADVADWSYLVVNGLACASLASTGALLTIRTPANPIGPLLLLAGALLAIGLLAVSIVETRIGTPGPAPIVAGVIGDIPFVYAIVIVLIGIPLIFPDGRLPGRRWRPLVWIALAAAAAIAVVNLFRPGAVGETAATNPLDVPALYPYLPILEAATSLAFLVGVGGAAAAVWLRYRRGSRMVRHQLKWFVTVASVAAIAATVASVAPSEVIGDAAFVLATLALVGLPIAIAIAILRYRLYEIDRIISRTISWSIVSVVLVAVFVAVVVGLQTVLADLTDGNTLAVAASTLVVFAVFQPFRRRVQAAVDRRFDRSKVDAERTVAALTTRLRNDVDLDAVRREVLVAVDAALRPTVSGLWLRRAGRGTS
jgi:hypothetical protein